MGFGMSKIMVGEASTSDMIVGLITGIVGLIVCVLNYPIYAYKRSKEPIIKGMKLTNFASALTSIILTQVVLLDTFSSGYDSTINGYTGMGVSLIIISLGLYMVIGAKKDNNS